MNTTAQSITYITTDADIADALGELRAEQNVLKQREKILVDLLKSKRTTEVDGAKYRVTITYDIIRKKVDWKALAARLSPSHQLVRAHTTMSESDRVSITALKK